jgi:hypothetical protein
MYVSGVSLYVLADHFLVHQNHAYEEVVRKNEVSQYWVGFGQADYQVVGAAKVKSEDIRRFQRGDLSPVRILLFTPDY